MPLPAGLLSTGRKELCDWRRKQGKCQGGGVRDRELARDVPPGIFGLYEHYKLTKHGQSPSVLHSGSIKPPVRTSFFEGYGMVVKKVVKEI
jgi:hypothetical protein